jgi:glycosyltransferase involved in cell wall biosynthesis
MFPIPPSDGGKMCLYQFVDGLRHKHHVHLLVPAYGESQFEEMQRGCSDEWPNVALTIVKNYNELAAIRREDEGKRLKIRIKKKLKSVLGLPASKQHPVEPLRFDINNKRYDLLRWYAHNTGLQPISPYIIEAVTQLLEEKYFDIVQVEFPPLLGLATAIQKYSGLKIFVVHESRSAIMRDYAVANNLQGAYPDYMIANCALMEGAWAKMYDAILTLNDADTQEWQSKTGALVPVFTSPFGVLPSEIQEVDENVIINNLVFVGSQNHYPNEDALVWLVKEILPLIPKGIYENVFITGVWNWDFQEKMVGYNEKVKFVGFVDNLSDYLIKSVSVVPIRLGGGGMRGKVLTAMASGSPVVGTFWGITGIDAIDGESFYLADDAAKFAACVSKLLTDKQTAHRMAKSANNLIRSKYSQEHIVSRREAIYHQLLDNRKI